MSFRTRLALAVAAAVAAVVVIALPAAYAIVRGQLRGEVDDALRARAQFLQSLPLEIERSRFTGRRVLKTHGHGPDALADPASFLQVYDASNGARTRPERPDLYDVPLPVGSRVRDVALRKSRGYLTDAEVRGLHVRMLVEPIGIGNQYALQVMRPLGEVDSALGRIKRLLLLLAAAGIGAAAVLGLVVARGALAPVRRLTSTAEHVSETRDLTSRIDVQGTDELARLATTFNTMLAALEGSAVAQRRLVTDASHELRTPLTSLRTNIELLQRHDLEEPRRREILAAAVEQLEELTALVSELVELARGEQPAADPEDVRLDLLVADAVARAQRNRPTVEFSTSLDEVTVHGVPARLDRAVSNLLDNAAKWSPPGAPIEVSVRNGAVAEVAVRDHGPGISDDDLPYVFDRFYRAPAARGMPGSGLGLSIVKQVADAHDGEVTAERAADGGTRVRLRLSAAR
jgi:two-component system sensor histidine kinase MprB